VVVRVAPLDEILSLRHAVLRPGRPLASAHFDGDEEPTTVHAGAFEAGEVLGCASVMRRPFAGADAAQVRGMATLPARARTGIGRTVLAFIDDLVAAEWRLDLMWCNARTSAAGFYERAGWTIVSPEFDIPDVGPHVRMVRRLALPSEFP
jgi:GNAT superfamily N-acetyltransferase